MFNDIRQLFLLDFKSNNNEDSTRNIQGWLLFTPAAILLLAFTHYPTITTFFQSLYTNKSILRPRRFSGVEAYEVCLVTPYFGKFL